MTDKPPAPEAPVIHSKIYTVQNQRVIFDSDLASLFRVETRSLIQAMKRNSKKFPKDFAFQLSKQELKDWRSQIVISNPAAKMSLRRRPYVFTEHGVVMAATVLNSPVAVEMSIQIVRVFIHSRKLILDHKELTKRLVELENRIARRLQGYEEELQEIRFTIQQLMIPDDQQQPARPIGFRNDD